MNCNRCSTQSSRPQPVFARHVADIAIVEDQNIRIRASFAELAQQGQVVSLDRSTVMGRAVLDKALVHLTDIQSAGDSFSQGRELARKYGHHSIVGVPLMREDRSVGALLLRRREVEPFSKKQIALLQTFADQAVIAIENARLFEEVKRAPKTRPDTLEYQTATSEVLSIISRSRFEFSRSLIALSEPASRLCGAKRGRFLRFEEKGFGSSRPLAQSV